MGEFSKQEEYGINISIPIEFYILVTDLEKEFIRDTSFTKEEKYEVFKNIADKK